MGKIIQFYKPEKKRVQPAPEPEEPGLCPPEDVFKKLTAVAGDLEVVLVMMRNKKGELAFVSNLPDLAQSVLFIEQIKAKAISSGFEENGGTA